MDGSTVQTSHIRDAARALLQSQTDHTDAAFEKTLQRYETLMIDNEGSVPDDLDLLRPETALPAFLRKFRVFCFCFYGCM